MDVSSVTFAHGSYPLKDIPAPHPHDVLCGRGGGTNNHVGNSHWRMLVAANKQLYVTLPKRQKMLLSRSIVNAVRSQNPPGRFLQKDGKSDLWYDVGDQRAQEKTSQALREGAPDIRNKLNKTTAPGPAQSKEAPVVSTPASAPPPPPPAAAPAPSVPPAPAPVATNVSSPATNMMAAAPTPMRAATFPTQAAPTAFPMATAAPTMDASTAMMTQQPVMVQMMTPNGIQNVPMYPATPMMMTPATGMNAMPTAGMPTMMGMGMPVGFAPNPAIPPMRPQIPDQTPGAQAKAQQKQAPPSPAPATAPAPGNQSPKVSEAPRATNLSAQTSGQVMPPPKSISSGTQMSSSIPSNNGVQNTSYQNHMPQQLPHQTQQRQSRPQGHEQQKEQQQQQQPQHQNGQQQQQQDQFNNGEPLPMSSLEPAGLSFGSVSMMSLGPPNNKLENTGTSFGSVMSFSVASKMPDMVDGGLEPIGTSFGSMSLNSTDHKDLARALEPDPISQATSFKIQTMMKNQQVPQPSMAPPVFAAQRSTGNLLECSDTDESDDEEEPAPNGPSKSAEWEKLQRMLAEQTKSKNSSIINSTHVTFDLPPPPPGGNAGALPTTTFEHNFSELSALSMGEFSDVHGDSDNEDNRNCGAAMPPPSLKKQDDSEKLEMMFLNRGSSLAFENFQQQQRRSATEGSGQR